MAKALLGTTDPRSEIVRKFFFRSDACGSCIYCWNVEDEQYDVCDSNCTGECQCQSPTASLHRLFALSGYADEENLEIPCAPPGTNPLDLPIRAYIELLLKYRFLLRLVIGLGVLSVALLGAVAYLLLR